MRSYKYRGFGIGLVLLARVGGGGDVGRALVLLLLPAAAAALVLPRFLPVGGGGGPVWEVGAKVGGHGGRRSLDGLAFSGPLATPFGLRSEKVVE
jgi:hypothetical protein